MRGPARRYSTMHAVFGAMVMGNLIFRGGVDIDSWTQCRSTWLDSSSLQVV
jgi:Zn-finger nucleic acid-binding protein